MKKDDFLTAMGGLEEKYLAEYARAKKLRRRKLITRITAIAASVCLVIGATAAAVPLLNRHNDIISETELLSPTEPQAVTPIEPLGPFRMISIEAEKTNGDFITCDSDFIVKAENGTADLVREHLYISGGPEYTVTEEENGSFRVSLSGSLSAGGVVSLSYANDGITEYSWAFETERQLEVISHTPGKNAANVDTSSVIELELSMPCEGSPEEYITFAPHISGRWEYMGKILRFIPDDLLPDDTEFTVTVAPGYSVGEYTLGEEYSFRFYTGEKPRVTQGASPNYGGMLYFTPTEQVILRQNTPSNSEISVSEVRLYTFDSADELIAYLDGDEAILSEEYLTPGFTCERASTFYVDIFIGELPAGYYLAQISDSSEDAGIVRSPICVYPVNAYACVTERDIVVWADDKDISIRYNDKSAVTNDNGIALLKDATDGSGKAGYVYLGDEAQPLVFAVPNYSHENYPGAYLYTDKPLYKTDDTVHFWGVIPTALFRDGTEGEFSVEFESSGGIIRTVTVTPDEDGVFSGEISYTDLAESYAYLYLNYNGKSIASRYFSIQDYYLQNYIYDIDCEKRYVTVGSKLDFSVSVTHISGVKVIGKRLSAKVDDTLYYAVTDESGVAHFSIPGPTDDISHYGSNGNSQLREKTLELFSGDPEEGSAAYESIEYLYYYVVREDADLEYKSNYIGSYDLNYTFKGVYLKPEKTDSLDTVSSTDFYEYGAPLNGTISIDLITETRERTGSTVDPYTGKQKITYSDPVSKTETIATEKVCDVSEYVFDGSKYELPEATELTCYSLKANFSFSFGQSNIDSGYIYLASNRFLSAQPEDNILYNNVGVEIHSRTLDGFSQWEYSQYRYIMTGNTSNIAVGEEVPLTLYDTVSGTHVTEGYLLRILYHNGVVATELVPANEASFIYKEEYGPFVKVTYAYHLNGRFYRLPSYTVTQDIDERTITVTQETDKDSYAPGEEVTLTVKTTDHKGEPVSCAVNVSVVNEAVFVERPHHTGILAGLITNNSGNAPMYSFSTYFDRDLIQHGGGMGDGGGRDYRTNFADTAYFGSVRTDENGVATVTFTLPDSVTEYRITTHAAKGDMHYGVTKSNFTVNMDFFLQSNAPRGQKHTDDYVAYATTVSKNSGSVFFSFTLKETGQTLTATAPAGASASVNFGKLPVGTYTLRVDASMDEYTDGIEYPIEVTPGNMTHAVTQQLTPDEPLTVTPSSYPVKVEIYTESTERYLRYFNYLSSLSRTRLDTQLASYKGDQLYSSIMGEDGADGYVKLSSDYIGEEGLRMYPEGADDLILTALCNYYTPTLHRSTRITTGTTPDSYIRTLAVQTALGNSTLSELRVAHRYAEEDEQLAALIGLSYAFLGDYDSAKQIYASLPEHSDIRGVDALRAILSTFVDRQNAAAVIDTLIAEEPDEFYLGFAVVAYLQNRIDFIDEDHVVTVTANGKEYEYTVNGVQKEILFPENDTSGSVTLSYSGDEKTRVSVTYLDYEQAQSSDSFYGWLEGDMSKYGTAYLMIDVSGYEGSRNISIALPPALRVCGSFSSDSGLYGSAKHEHIRILATKDYQDVIRIPLLLTQSGNYTLEPIKLTTEGGNVYYSNEIVLDIE